MDMYQKRKMRQEKKNNESNQENFSKTSINWFPGHMAKTRRQITEDLKLIDIVVEILDARIPVSSQNPEIREITKNKKKVIVLNKCDLADEEANKKWINHYKMKGINAVLTDSQSGKGIDEVVKKIQLVAEEDIKKINEKGRVGRKTRVMVIGIPNVGKSSFINRITKKNLTQVGNKPGVTRTKQWIRINDKIELMDTPGVLWPKFENENIALNLAFTGTIKDEIMDLTEIAYNLTNFLLKNYKINLITRYSLDEKRVDDILGQNQEENVNIYEIMQIIGKNRGAIVSGGNIDDEKTSRIILDDFRNGRFGRITLEKI